jgi:hypothetical protein
VLVALRHSLGASKTELVARAVRLETRLPPPFPLSAELMRLKKLP